ncbi:MAG: Holliday junction resolvase RuvX [Solirubrobacterales bacterium]
MRVLAIDHGNARAGVAVCDPTETITRPLDVIEPPDPADAARVAAEEGAELIVVGLPLSLDGSEGEQAEIARRFAADLARATDVPVETYDERLTSRMAAETARSGASAPADSIAAAHLLDGFLLSRRAER